MSFPKASPESKASAAPLSIEQLELGLRLLGQGDIEQNAFWDENIEAFRQTVLFAIRDTSDALLLPAVPERWRLELERQLEQLVRYIELADRYITRRRSERDRQGSAFPLVSNRIH